MGRFWEFVRQAASADGCLPLTHATDLMHFRQIITTSRLEPQECPVYTGEKLLYFFYGRPSYRPNAKAQTLTARAFLPICLVMDRNILDKMVRIMPFDTGAFHNKMMHPPMHDDMSLKEFELEVHSTAPMRLIQMFYDSERKYFDAKARSISEITYDEYEDLEVDSYLRMLHHRANSPADDRVSAIEIQLHTPVDVAGRILAAILPKPYLDRPGIRKQIESWGAILIPYHVKEEFVPREAHAAISERLVDYLEKYGHLRAS